MKKYVQEATDINIWTSIKNNTFERNKDIKEFIDGLELIDESACISLDAKWGDGKTFFVRQIEEVLPSSTGTYISSESYFISLFVACIILLDIIDIPEKKKFLEGKSTFVASVLPELKAYQRFVNRLIGDGNSTVEESQFQSNCEEVVKVYKYAFETESDEYYERFEISRELKQKCIAASNGHKYY